MQIDTTNAAAVAAEVRRIQTEFARPFAADEIKIKPAMVKGNRCLALHYVDARLVMDRLDEVAGVAGWKDEYTVLPTGEVECRLSVRFGAEWVMKADVGGQSEQADEGDRMKAAYSDALKRAAVKFGVGRHLYRIPQTWMDYDPVKKQIVRPRPVANPREKYDRQLDAVKNRQDAQAAYRAITTDKGLPQDVAQELLNRCIQIGRRFPAPQQKVEA